VKVMAEKPAPTWKMKAAVFGAWFLLVVILGAHGYWRVLGRRVRDCLPPLTAPWLLGVHSGVIVAGLVLACTRWLPGRTPMRRYWASVCVGVICMTAMGFLLLCVCREFYSRLDIVWCGSPP
jgi:hypothetical protein